MTVQRAEPGHQQSEARPYAGTWIVLPTYNEADNLEQIAEAILEQVPGARLLVVDDASPDGTGQLAARLAEHNDDVSVLHRPGKQGLGRAYVDGFKRVLAEGAEQIVQMDADWSHHPRYLPALLDVLAPQQEGGVDGAQTRVHAADLVIGSRYVPGGGVRNWGLLRRLVSRGGSLFARIVLGLPVHDLTGGFKAWRRETLAALPLGQLHSGGYVFQIETTFRASRQGARLREVPIVFDERRLGVSKMSRRIVFEAFFIVLRLRWDELRGRLRERR